MKDYGMCRECGKPIRKFRYALPDWLCRYCYQAKFPGRTGISKLHGQLSNKSRIADEESYEFLKAHLYDKPGLYERSFRMVRDYSPLLRNFASLGHLLDFVQLHRRCAPEIKQELAGLVISHQWLKPRIIEILLFVLWDDLVDKYGKGERFSQGYFDLITGLDPTTKDDAESWQTSNGDNTPPPVPETNKDIWNYQGSKILLTAVAKGVINRFEAEVVMEVVVYDRDWFDIQEIMGVSTGEAFYLYETGLTKLSKWLPNHILILPDKHIICD